MTEALRDLLGEAIYETLTRGLEPFHPRMIEQRVPEGRIKEIDMITHRGVEELKTWTAKQIDELSNIGDSKTQRILNALKTLERRAHGEEDREDGGFGESDSIV